MSNIPSIAFLIGRVIVGCFCLITASTTSRN